MSFNLKKTESKKQDLDEDKSMSEKLQQELKDLKEKHKKEVVQVQADFKRTQTVN